MTSGAKNVDSSPEGLQRGEYPNASNSTCMLQKSHSPWLNMHGIRSPPAVQGAHVFFLLVWSDSRCLPK